MAMNKIDLNKNIVINEIIVSLILGGGLTLVIFIFSNRDLEKLLAWLNNLPPKDVQFYYSLSLLLFHQALTWFSRQIIPKNNTVNAFTKNLLQVTDQVGTGIHSVYRVISGAIPISIGLFVYRFGATNSLPTVILALYTYCLFTLFSSLLHVIIKRAKPRTEQFGTNPIRGWCYLFQL